jgi:hypothetical protein
VGFWKPVNPLGFLKGNRNQKSSVSGKETTWIFILNLSDEIKNCSNNVIYTSNIYLNPKKLKCLLNHFSFYKSWKKICKRFCLVLTIKFFL